MILRTHARTSIAQARVSQGSSSSLRGDRDVSRLLPYSMRYSHPLDLPTAWSWAVGSLMGFAAARAVW